MRFKNHIYKGQDYSNYSNNFFSHNKNRYKSYKSYKSHYSYNHHSNSNINYNTNNNEGNSIEKEIELNSKEETEGDSDIKIFEMNEDNNDINKIISQECQDSNLNNNMKFSINKNEKTEGINSLEPLNINLIKSQSDEISLMNIDLHDVGIKLFPGAFCYKAKNDEPNKMVKKDNLNHHLNEEKKKSSEINFECNNFLCKSNSTTIKSEQKNGLALAFDYYSSFLEDKIK